MPHEALGQQLSLANKKAYRCMTWLWNLVPNENRVESPGARALGSALIALEPIYNAGGRVNLNFVTEAIY